MGLLAGVFGAAHAFAASRVVAGFTGAHIGRGRHSDGLSHDHAIGAPGFFLCDEMRKVGVTYGLNDGELTGAALAGCGIQIPVIIKVSAFGP